MKSVRFILLALSATVSLGVLPSCSQMSVREAVNYIMFGNKEGRLSSSETISSTSSSEVDASASSSEADELVSSSEEYYDSVGYPIFGYDGAYPVYGYDPSGNPIYDKTQLDENSTVPSWSPTSDSSAGNGYAAPPSYDPHRLGPNPRLLLWYTLLKRASEAPPSARHRYGKHLFRKPRHRDYVGYGEFWGKPERDADKHKRRHSEPDADKGGSREKERHGRAEKGKKKSSR